MSRDMKLHVASCEECQRRNHTKPFRRGLMFSPEVFRKFERIGVDIYSGIPKGSITQADNILVMTNYLTKWVVAILVEHKHWITAYGPPEKIIWGRI